MGSAESSSLDSVECLSGALSDIERVRAVPVPLSRCVELIYIYMYTLVPKIRNLRILKMSTCTMTPKSATMI